MQDLREPVAQRLGTQLRQIDEGVARHARAYQCGCGNRIFFRNTLCLACNSQLGYLPGETRMAALDAGAAPGTWRAEGRAGVLKSCSNRDSPAGCHWLLEAGDATAVSLPSRLT